ncbi:YhcH/YjgK/YiaL family protein [Vibrio sp. JC009]|uniref:YhcH/YjgK/YiaL family protein n=1 Tax=Vibrio sp. JC009 TaxID=2912314 RepID=UPI0023B0BA43|nr:YhcH/YjgK/YiaL family protein [Vibrio sp. JC009]WED24602.1 YhcH/YjgK/YiaL family protein [Vibrio sp. JC009]
MLFGNINQLDLLPYTYTRLRSCIDEAMAIARENEDGNYPLSDSRIFVVLASAQTEPVGQRAAEIHKKYIDVQILLEGEEQLGYSNQLDEETRKIEVLPDDLLFVDEVTHENFVTLTPGDFALFYPNQIHRPLCASGEPGAVRKAIIKIPHELFS